MSHMEMPSLRLLCTLPAEENIAAYELSPPRAAEHLASPDWTATMNDHDWEEEEEGAARSALGGLTAQCQQPAAPEGTAVSSPPQADAPGELLKRLSALQLAEHRYNDERRRPPLVRSHVDARYPEPLGTEVSPRRRARSLPWNSIPEADVEDEEDALMCCCKLKKKVQFADSLGLCLASVKHFLPSEEPLVPQAVLARLQSYPPTVPKPELLLLEGMCFSECPIPEDLLARLEEQRVCLEQVSASALGINGYILVKDPGENAQVKIRYTFNEWLSFLDCPATAAQQCTGLGTQRFHFSLCYPPSTSVIHFAVCFTTGHGQDIWDNNQGVNYTVICQQNQLPDVQPASPEQEECEGPRLW